MLEWIWEKVKDINEAQQQQLQATISSYQQRGYSRKKAEIYAMWELNLIDGNPADICSMAGIS